MKISVRVKSNAKEKDVEETGLRQFLVKVKAPPRENRANLEVVEALAGYFHVAKSRVSIVSGIHSKQKVVQIEEG